MLLYEENIDNITLGCPIVTMIEYVIHYKFYTRALHSIYKECGTETAEKWYLHIPNQNQGVKIDGEVEACKPDVIMKEKKEYKTCMLVSVTTPSYRNIQKHAKKKPRYKHLSV